MFGKSKKSGVSENHDIEILMSMMDGVIAGNYEEVDTSVMNNPAYAEKLNELIRAFKKSNNNFVMRLNEAMESIGDNQYVKNTLDQVQSQTEAINDMQGATVSMMESINHISDSIGNIRDNTHDMLAVAQNSAANMAESITVVNQSSEQIGVINGRLQEFKAKIDKINEIVDVVKKVASQSNLLALNASIEAARAGEAGKGFAVVADQVRQLSSNTSESAEDIVKYVNELKVDMDALATSMNETTIKLGEGNEKVEVSLHDIEKMTDQVEDIRGKVDDIFQNIDTQSGLTDDLVKQADSIAASYDVLTQCCMEQGTHVFKIGRYIDTARSDMARGFAQLNLQDWLRVYTIDHFILMWRIYNNAIGFESLKLTQLNNVTSCKFGKFAGSLTDSKVLNSAEFKKAKLEHENVHKWACESWKAKDAGNVELALEYFKNTYDAYFAFKKAMEDLQSFYMRNGEKEKTQIIVFRN